MIGRLYNCLSLNSRHTGQNTTRPDEDEKLSGQHWPACLCTHTGHHALWTVPPTKSEGPKVDATRIMMVTPEVCQLDRQQPRQLLRPTAGPALAACIVHFSTSLCTLITEL
jgi:hypothetical protein